MNGNVAAALGASFFCPKSCGSIGTPQRLIDRAINGGGRVLIILKQIHDQHMVTNTLVLEEEQISLALKG